MVNGRRQRRGIIRTQNPEKDLIKDPSPLYGPILFSAIITIVLAFFGGIAIAVFFALCAIAYLVYCTIGIGKVSFEKHAIKLVGYTPDLTKYYSGGIYFLKWPFEHFRMEQTEPIQIDIPPQKIISAVYGPYSATVVELDLFFYVYAPQTAEALMNYFRYTPNDDNEKVKKDNNNEKGEKRPTAFENFFIQAVIESARTISGKYSWHGLAIGDPEYIAALRDAILNYPTIVKARISEIVISNTAVKLPDPLKDAITKPQIATLDGEATKITANADQFKLERQGDGEAYKIQKTGAQEVNIKDLRLKAMAENPEMAQIDVYREATQKAGTLILSMDSQTGTPNRKTGDVMDLYEQALNSAKKIVGSMDDPEKSVINKRGIDNIMKLMTLPLLSRFTAMTEEQQTEFLNSVAKKKLQKQQN